MDYTFDFLCDAMLHVREVADNLETIASELRKRGLTHDMSKFQELEFDAFVSTREKFKKANFGSPEYKECTRQIAPAIKHHYENNRHHTGFHDNGINSMNLIDVIEMICDWKAASRRSPDKKFGDSLEYSFKNYKIDPQLKEIIMNTLRDLKWIPN